MTSRHDELELFKTRIDLREYAASVGYVEDAKASCRSSTVMRDAAGDKVVIALDASDGHFVYFSVREDGDNGSIVDFVQRRDGGNLGDVRKTLRPWLTSPPTAPRKRRLSFELQPTSRDLGRVRARLAAMESLETRGDGSHPYLVETRRLPPALLAQPRFAPRIFRDERGNAVFPHFDRASGGICGYEVKGQGFSGFSPGGSKGLWASIPGPDDTRLVVAESAIDALSWAALHADSIPTRFVSIGGALSPAQPELLTAAMEKLPHRGRVVLAFDNDNAGRKLADQIEESFAKAKRNDLELVVDFPPTAGKDWNDVLLEVVARRKWSGRHANGEQGPSP